MPRGGAREGSGRPKMPVKKKRIMVSVKVLPAANDKWGKLAEDIGLSKGKLVEKWLGFDPVPGLNDI